MRILLNMLKSQDIQVCQLLAEQATIEPVLEGCAFVGFIVQLHEFTFEKYLDSYQAVSAFKLVIEKRIEAFDFAHLYIHPASSEINVLGIPRVVFNPKERVLTCW